MGIDRFVKNQFEPLKNGICEYLRRNYSLTYMNRQAYIKIDLEISPLIYSLLANSVNKTLTVELNMDRVQGNFGLSGWLNDKPLNS